MRIFISLVILVLSSFALAEPISVSSLAGSLPNIICRIAYFDDQWHPLPPYVPAYYEGDQLKFGNIFGTYSDPVAPGFGICAARDRDASGKIVALKMFTYAFTGPFQSAPGSCEIQTSEPYEIVKQVKVTPQPGLVTSITMKRDDGTKYQFINYFMTKDDELAWAKDLKLPTEKCAELFVAEAVKVPRSISRSLSPLD